MGFLKKNKTLILYVIIFILFLVTIFITGYYHEPWADEAQAFLHARDFSFKELIFEKLKYEGHPILWYALLQLILSLKFITPQMVYENFYIISCIFSSIAVFLFLFKSKLPVLVKILVPFSYFILYQYSVIARNHSFVFLFFALIAVFHKDRLKRPYLYSFLLILLANVSAYSFVISGILFVSLFYDFYKEHNKNIKKYIPIFLTALFLFITVVYMQPPVDSASVAKFNLAKFSVSDFLFNIQSCFFKSKNILFFVIQLCLIIWFYVSTAITFCRKKSQFYLFFALNITLFFFFTCLYVNDWHQGYIILCLIFSMWIFSEENSIYTLNFNENKAFFVLFLILFSVQVFWGITTSFLDIKYDYCPSKAVSEYIKRNSLEEKGIVAIGFKTVAIQPYFEKNIFKNYENEAICSWQQEKFVRKLQLVNYDSNVILVEANLYKKVISGFKDYWSKNNLSYKEKRFEGYMLSKGGLKESNSFVMFEKVE